MSGIHAGQRMSSVCDCTSELGIPGWGTMRVEHSHSQELIIARVKLVVLFNHSELVFSIYIYIYIFFYSHTKK